MRRYISMASAMNQDEKMRRVDTASIDRMEKVVSDGLVMIEDEPVPGGVMVEEKSQIDKQIEFYLGALILIGVGTKIISKYDI